MQPVLDSLKVRVVIPHYCSENGDKNGYGSTRPGMRDKRIVALGRTLGALRALVSRPGSNDFIFNHSSSNGNISGLPKLEGLPGQCRPVDLNVVVCVSGDAWLEAALLAFARTVSVARFDLDEPRDLGLAARDLLLAAEPIADLSIYLEDDLVINDSLFFEKQWWFLNHANNQATLMPNRYELDFDDDGVSRRLFVDGSIDEPASTMFPWSPLENAAQGIFQDEHVCFDLANNPHSGCFVLSTEQVRRLRKQGVPPQQWVGPLETAATMTPAHCFPVYKPSWRYRDFLTIEHAHHSFSFYFGES